MYQFIRIRILLFSSTDCKVVHVLPNAINITYNNFIVISTATAKHINAVTSSYSFQHIPCIWYMIKVLQSILMYVCISIESILMYVYCVPPFPTSVSVCSSFNNWVDSFVSISTEALLLHKTMTPTTHRLSIRS